MSYPPWEDCAKEAASSRPGLWYIDHPGGWIAGRKRFVSSDETLVKTRE
jgi:hypothetical protein